MTPMFSDNREKIQYLLLKRLNLCFRVLFWYGCRNQSDGYEFTGLNRKTSEIFFIQVVVTRFSAIETFMNPSLEAKIRNK